MIRLKLVGCIAPDKVEYGQLAAGVTRQPAVELVDAPAVEDQCLPLRDALGQLCARECLLGSLRKCWLR